MDITSTNPTDLVEHLTEVDPASWREFQKQLCDFFQAQWQNVPQNIDELITSLKAMHAGHGVLLAVAGLFYLFVGWKLFKPLVMLNAAILGAVLGFLWFNCHPAQTFMGDVGSLPLGAAMGYGALVTRNEILLLVIGGVFVIELLSVVLQVSYFKYTGGKRLFRCAPIHHHFHLIGWSEPQVVVRFWLLGAAFAALALATLKIR